MILITLCLASPSGEVGEKALGLGTARMHLALRLCKSWAGFSCQSSELGVAALL